MEANIRPDRVAVRIRLLIRMHVKQADSSVGLQAPLLAEHEQGTRSADLQVMRQ